jgi:hypothetical protein
VKHSCFFSITASTGYTRSRSQGRLNLDSKRQMGANDLQGQSGRDNYASRLSVAQELQSVTP